MREKWQEFKTRKPWSETSTYLTYERLLLLMGFYFLYNFVLQLILLRVESDMAGAYTAFRIIAEVIIFLFLVFTLYGGKKLATELKLCKGFSLRVLGNSILLGILCTIAEFAVSFLTSKVYSALGIIPEPQRVVRFLQDPAIAPILPLFVFRIVIAGPLIEEIYFRGIVMRTIANKHNLVTAIILSSLIFALIHFDYYQLPMLFIYGVIIAVVYAITDNIWYPYLIHVFVNSIGVIANLLIAAK